MSRPEKVLLVEDEPVLRRFMIDFVQDETGCSCETAGCGQEALMLLEKEARVDSCSVH